MSRRHRLRPPCFAGRPYIDPGAAGPLHEPDRAMFAFDHDLAELERAFYCHLLRAIDLDRLFGLEQQLWTELQDRDLFTDDQVLDISNAMLARSLERVAQDPRRSMKAGTLGPGGEVIDAPEPPHTQCPFCGPVGPGGRGRSGPEAGPARESSPPDQVGAP